MTKTRKKNNKKPLILWNHRWEFDKNPEFFFNLLFQLKEDKIEFEVAIIGESFKEYPEIFNKAKSILSNNIVQFGYCESFNEYAKWLWRADVLPITSNQDFFGISIIEAVYCNTYPILPQKLSYPELFKLEDNSILSIYKRLVGKQRQIYLNETRSTPGELDYEQGFFIMYFDYSIIFIR